MKENNLIISGKISTGKTRGKGYPLVSDVIQNEESMFILDSKGEYLNKFYNEFKENNYNIILINLRDLTKTNGWNVLEYPYKEYKRGNKDKAINYLEHLAKSIFVTNSQKIDPFWDNSAADLFIGLTLGLFECGKEDEINLNSVASMMDSFGANANKEDVVTSFFDKFDKTSPAYVFASSTIKSPMETKGRIVAVAKQKLRLFASRENLSKVLSKTTFNFEDIKDKKTVIIFRNYDEEVYMNCLSNIFIEQLYMFLSDTKTNGKFNFILDNFDNLSATEFFVNMLSNASVYNIRFVLMTRDEELLKEKYGKYIYSISDIMDIEKENINIEDEVIIDLDIRYPKINENVKIFNLYDYVYNSDLNK